MDLGTNTFHLLIAEGSMNDLHIIAYEQVAVKIGEGGINKGVILPAAFERGLSTMKRFRTMMDSCRVEKARAIATSALRNASNGTEFIEKVQQETGVVIGIIDGEREAGLIYQGVKAGGILSGENSLIMDIGGGSVEFIIGNSDHLVWKQSFEVGAARLTERFHHSDPISPASIEALNLFLEDTLTPLFMAVSETPVSGLIGSSGAYETFAEMAAWKRKETFNLKQTVNYVFDCDELEEIIRAIVLSTHAEREANPLIIPVRKDMIVTASLITRFILQKLTIKNVALCTYALKEGVLAEMMG